MPNCPKCVADINHLSVDILFLNGGKRFCVKGFSCPVCGQPLFKCEEEASKFLRGVLCV